MISSPLVSSSEPSTSAYSPFVAIMRPNCRYATGSGFVSVADGSMTIGRADARLATHASHTQAMTDFMLVPWRGAGWRSLVVVSVECAPGEGLHDNHARRRRSATTSGKPGAREARGTSYR